MTTIFEDAALAASGAIDTVYGETLQFIPMVQGRNRADAQDPARQSVTLTGAFVARPVDLRINAQNAMGRDLYPEFTGARVIVSFDNAALAGLTIRQGDVIQRVDHDGQPKYQIISKPVPGPVRTRFGLAEFES